MKSEFEETPFPRLGEVVHFIVHAFGLVGRGDALRKRLERFAKESDFNLTEANEIIDEALLKPLREINEPFADEMAVWITKLLIDYKTIILTVRTDIATRAFVLSVLPSKYGHFIPSAIIFLKTVQKQSPDAPDFKQWFESKDIIAVKEVLSWWMKTYQVSEKAFVDFMNLYKPEDCRYEDYKDSIYRRLRRWKSGENLPDFDQFRALKQEKEGDNLVIWLLLARAWQSICQSMEKLFGEEGLTLFLRSVNETYQTVSDEFNVNPEIVQEFLFIVLRQLNGTDNSHKDYLEHLRESFYEECLEPFQNISLQREKKADEEIQAQATLKAIEQHKFYKSYQYLSELGWARYYAMCCDYPKALEHYKKAFEQGKYRAGYFLFDILKELLTLAAFLDKNRVIQSHYRWACLMDFFSGESNAPELWEIKQFKMAFFRLFPVGGLYQSVSQDKKDEMARKQEEVLRRERIFYEKGWEKWSNASPDLRNPNRMVKDFDTKSITQLMIFSQLGQTDKVKRLLKAGADPNMRIKLDNGTALIIALQNGNIEIAKLLLEHPKIAESINARTRRKKITALEVAIDKGYVDIVRRIIEKGVDIEQGCDIEEMSPLYTAIMLFHVGEKMRATGLPPIVPPENKSPSFFRRLSEFGDVFRSGNVFNQDFPNRDALITAELLASPELFKTYKKNSDYFVELGDKTPLFFNTDFSKFIQIVDILIEAGADVNKPHKHGFTPFLHSAEIGDIKVFRRLYEAGGQDHLTDCVANDLSILIIAIGYGKFDIAAYILKHGDKKQLRQIINNQYSKTGYTALHAFINIFWQFKKNKCYSDERMNEWKQTVWGKLLDLEPDLTLKEKGGLTAEMFADCRAMPSFALDLQKRRKGV